MFQFEYGNKSKVMHWHGTLGRGAMKRARQILIYFGFIQPEIKKKCEL